jgi:AraC-like DNA-binding protein
MTDYSWIDRYRGLYATTLDGRLFIGISSNTESIHRTAKMGEGILLTWVITGEGELSASGETYRITDNSIIFRHPNVDYTLTLYPFCHHRRCYLSIPGELINIFEKIYPGLDDVPSVFHTDSGQKRLDEFLLLFKEIKGAYNTDFFSLMPSVEKYMLSFLSPYLTGGSQALLRRAKYLLEKEYGMSLPEIADEAGMAYNTFRKEFTQSYGISPSQYRIQAKISRSKQLLSMGLTSKEIVEELGYQDTYTFSHQFKKVTGLSPREYKGRNVL